MSNHRLAQQYYMATVSLQSSPREQPSHISFQDGALLLNRYRIIGHLGDGVFGRVLDVLDKVDRKRKALKFIKIDPNFDSTIENEESIIRLIHQDSSPHRDKIIRLLNSFQLEGYHCLVFERLGSSLYDITTIRGYENFTLKEVRCIGRQILEGVALMHRLGITHCDLKPENILLMSDETRFHKSSKLFQLSDLRVKIIDFGIATYDWDYHCPLITTQEYRAPEVFLELGWSQSADLWSIGCILLELFTGKTVFPFSSEYCHLAMMEKVLGRVPTSMVRACNNSLRRKFSTRLQLQWPKGAEPEERLRVEEKQQLHVSITQELIPSDSAELLAFLELLQGLLEFNPSRRLTAEAALQSAFFHDNNRS